MGTTSRRNEVDTFLSSSAPDSLNNLTQSRAIEAYNGNEGDNIINHLDIAEGLKDALVRYGFKLDSLLIMQPNNLAEILGIDEYVAKLIISAVHDIKNKASTGSNAQHRIMMVDDEQDIARLFTIALQDNGFVVDVFNDPLSALSNYKAGLYDLLLLDIRMPTMNGFELYQKIRDIDDRAEVCFITAYEEFLHDFKRLFPVLEEVDCFVTKPIEMHNLVKIVKSKVDCN
ncbi:MAG: response regulator [Nitrososphaeraceae archaeon]|jgi:CheY-like chemotaxis protein